MIGVLGGFGQVGRETVRLLRASGQALRVGGRHPLPLDGAQSRAVDVTDAASLLAFADGCALVVNCAAPSSRLSAGVAATLRAAGIPLVDAGGVDCPEHLPSGNSAALFAAGALPGLSAALPLWLAQSLMRVDRLRCWFGVMDRFSAAGAEDYLDGVLRAGAPRGGGLRRQSGITLPFFPRPLTLQPFEDDETRAVAQRLELREGSWCLALEGEHLAPALEQAATLPRTQAVARVVEASALDAAGRRPAAQFLISLDGERPDGPVSLTLRLAAPGISALTAACAAASALWLLDAPAPVAGWAAECIPPEALVARLRQLPTNIEFAVFDSSVEALSETTGGAL